MSKPNQHALTVLADPALTAKDGEVELLKTAVAQQFASVANMEGRAARGGILCGLTLHRLKASLPHGQFLPFIDQMFPEGTFKQSPITRRKNTSYYMRLSMIFIEKARIQKPDILALPGDPLSLDLGDNANAQRFMSKLDAFAGDLSLNELLIKHGIKGVGLKTELDEAAKAEEAQVPGAAEDYFADVAERVYGFRQIVTNRESLSRLTPQQLDTLHTSVSDTYSEFKRLYAEAKQGAAITV